MSLLYPIFLPDATRAVVRSLDSEDLKRAGVEGIVVNAFHLMQTPGLSILKNFKGVKGYMNFNGLVVSDSGGFQIMSLIHLQKIKGKITEKGLEFTWQRQGRGEKVLFTPEKSIETQFVIGADVIVCLDYFTKPGSSLKEIDYSVKLTTEWASRCKAEFQRQLKLRKRDSAHTPKLMGVIQGGADRKYRSESARALLKIGFDIYGYGGWPMDNFGKFNNELFKYNARLTPDDKPRFALGVGMPEDIVVGVEYGYDFFDCVLPTRDARHYRLYVFSKDFPSKLKLRSHLQKGETFYRFLYINRAAYMRDKRSVSDFCECYTCQNYSRAYLHHLFVIKDALAWRLATIHNLYFYNTLIKLLRY